MKVKKVVPVILRQHNSGLQILVFRHPLAGIQIVKGTVEPNESLEYAVLRELFEESGILNATVQKFLGVHYPKDIGPNWYVFLCETDEFLLEKWTHYCQDDGGLELKFFWYPLFSTPIDEWHPLFQDLLYFIQNYLTSEL